MSHIKNYILDMIREDEDFDEFIIKSRLEQEYYYPSDWTTNVTTDEVSITLVEQCIETFKLLNTLLGGVSLKEVDEMTPEQLNQFNSELLLLNKFTKNLQTKTN